MNSRRSILSNPVQWWQSLKSEERISLIKNLKIDRQLRRQRNMRLNYSLGLDEIFDAYWPNYQVSETLSPDDVLTILDLTHLTFAKTNLTGIEFIWPIQGIQVLYLNDTRIEDIGILPYLKKLKVLNCSTTQVKNFVPLRHAKNLVDLDLSLTDFANGDHLENCGHLKKLHLYKTSLEYTYGFDKLTNLRELYLDWSPVKNLWGLKDLKRLKTIFCNHTKIEDLHPVPTLTALQAIYCSHTKIRSLESAYGHPKMEFVQCDNTLITEREVNNSRFHIKSVSIKEPDFSRFDNEEAREYVDRMNEEEIERIRRDIKEKDGDYTNGDSLFPSL